MYGFGWECDSNLLWFQKHALLARGLVNPANCELFHKPGFYTVRGSICLMISRFGEQLPYHVLSRLMMAGCRFYSKEAQ